MYGNAIIYSTPVKQLILQLQAKAACCSAVTPDTANTHNVAYQLPLSPLALFIF